MFCNKSYIVFFGISGKASRAGIALSITMCLSKAEVWRKSVSVPCSQSNMPKTPKQLLNLKRIVE